MPTYRNTSSVTKYILGCCFPPGADTPCYKIIYDPDLQKVSDEPYIPLASNHVGVSGDVGEEIEVPVDLENLRAVLIRNITAPIEIRLNTPNNPTYWPAYPEDMVVLYADHDIEKLYIKFPSVSGSCLILEIHKHSAISI